MPQFCMDYVEMHLLKHYFPSVGILKECGWSERKDKYRKIAVQVYIKLIVEFSRIIFYLHLVEQFYSYTWDKFGQICF